MKCPKCGNKINKDNFCPICRQTLSAFELRAGSLSAVYYNRGLELAKSHDLSSAVCSLEKSIAFNKNNINAHNLLGLIYFEMGDVSNALAQWIISINFRSEKNIANEYIKEYEHNKRQAEAMENSIKLYNEALENVRERNDDMAIISLKKALNLNPRYIEALNLLALCYLMHGKNSAAVDLINTVLKQDINNEKALGYYRQLYPDKSRPVPKGYLSDPRNSAYYMPQTAMSGNIRTSRRRQQKKIPVIPMFFAGCAVSAIIIFVLVMPSILQQKQQAYDVQVSQYNQLKQEYDELSTKYNESTVSLSADSPTGDLPLQERVKQINQAEMLYSNDNATEAALILVNLDTTDFTAEIMEQYSKQKQLILPLAAEQFYTRGKEEGDRNNNDSAREMFNQCLKCCQEGDEIRYSALYQLGRIAIAEGDIKTAVNCYTTVAERHPVMAVKNEAKRFLEENGNG